MDAIQKVVVKLAGKAKRSTRADAVPPVPSIALDARPKSPALPPVGAELGILRVEGTPRGARVDVSGPSGFKGPNAVVLPRTWTGVPAGMYQVKVQAKNYEMYKAIVRVLPDRTKVVGVKLLKLHGVLTIGGTPLGAKVELSGPAGFRKVFGLTSGFTFRRIRRGAYTVRVTRTGYTTYNRRVGVVGGKWVSVSVNLPRVDASETEKKVRRLWIGCCEEFVSEHVIITQKGRASPDDCKHAYVRGRLGFRGVARQLGWQSLKRQCGVPPGD